MYFNCKLYSYNKCLEKLTGIGGYSCSCGAGADDACLTLTHTTTSAHTNHFVDDICETSVVTLFIARKRQSSIDFDLPGVMDVRIIAVFNPVMYRCLKDFWFAKKVTA